jgi:hypothetical protein
VVGRWSPSLLLMPTLPAPTRPARRPRLVQPALHDSPPREPRCITGLGRGRENGRGLPKVPRVRDERGTRAGSFQLARVLRRSCLDMLAIKMRCENRKSVYSSLRDFGLFKNETGRHRVTHHEVSSFIHDV